MFKLWTRWRISTAIDSGKPISPRLAHRVRRDPQLRRFYETSLTMADRLRDDADAVVQQPCEPLGESALPQVAAPTTSRRNRRAVRRAGLLSLASALTVAFVVIGLKYWPRETEPLPPDPPKATALKDKDLQELLEVARLIDATVEHVATEEGPRIRARMARSREAIKQPILREVAAIKADSRGLLDRFLSLVPKVKDLPEIEPSPAKPNEPPAPAPSDQTAPFSRSATSLICSR